MDKLIQCNLTKGEEKFTQHTKSIKYSGQGEKIIFNYKKYITANPEFKKGNGTYKKGVYVQTTTNKKKEEKIVQCVITEKTNEPTKINQQIIKIEIYNEITKKYKNIECDIKQKISEKHGQIQLKYLRKRNYNLKSTGS